LIVHFEAASEIVRNVVHSLTRGLSSVISHQ
jgi:hypothetical protein